MAAEPYSWISVTTQEDCSIKHPYTHDFLITHKSIFLFSEPDFQGLALSTRTSEVIYADSSTNGQRVAAVRIRDGSTRTLAGGIYPTALAVDNQEG